MSVSSYLELYLSVFGWRMFDSLWDILTSTGLAYLPFIGMLLRNSILPMYKQDFKEASTTSLRGIELDVALMLTVVVLATQPVLDLTLTNLSYTKACSGTAAVSGGTTGTTYDTSFSTATLGGSQAQVPIWWYGVLAISNGVNDAAIASIPCSADIRLLTYKMHNSTLTDPRLRNQVQLFYNDCYQYAMGRFLDTQTAYPSTLPTEDLYWPGSTFLQNTFYDQKRASTGIPGFPYSATRDLEYDPAIEIPTYGKPTCNEWWNGTGASTPADGLRQAILNQYDPALLTDVETTVTGMTAKTQTEVDDIAVKTLINKEQAHFNGLENLPNYNDTGHFLINGISGSIGSVIESLSFYPKMYMVKVAAPIIQAMVLMIIYTLLPLILVISSYDIGVMTTLSIILFSVKFWTVLWAITHWLDNHLLVALQPGAWYQFHQLVNGNITSIPETMINFVTGLMFVGLPIVWSGMLSWAGVRVGNEISEFSKDNFGQANATGASGVSVARDTIVRGLKKK